MSNKQIKTLNIKCGHCKAQLTLFEKYLNQLNEENLSLIELNNLKERLIKIVPR